MQTQQFRAGTTYRECNNARVKGCWQIGLDMGYSSVKGFSPNSRFNFPTFARKREVGITTIGEPHPSDILYEGPEGMWDVGELAVNSLLANDVEDSVQTLYARHRYDSAMFRVAARVGMAMAMRKNTCGELQQERLVLQTGLPSAYRTQNDSAALVDALKGEHSFRVKFGASPWQEYNFFLPRENIYVTQQPLGSYFSACMDDNANMTMLGRRYYNSNILLFDAGFGTVDIGMIQARTRKQYGAETYARWGMKEVFRRTVEEIQNRYQTEIAVHALSLYLDTGKVPVLDRRLHKRQEMPFDDLLLRHSQEVCNEVLDKMETAFDGLSNCQGLLIAGGTGAAWLDYIAKRYEQMEGMEVIRPIDGLPYIYAIARGYYLVVTALLRGEAK